MLKRLWFWFFETPGERLLRRWLKALRSGKYRQGRRKLRQPDLEGECFCCLGVLCEILVEDKILRRSETRGDEYVSVKRGESFGGVPDTEDLPQDFVELFNYSLSSLGPDNHVLQFNPFVELPGSTETLTGLNDYNGENFEGIADWIELSVERKKNASQAV